MKWLANLIMDRRAKRLYVRIRQHMPERGAIADIGSGTGHNARLLRDQTELSISEFDVDDIHWVGPAPELISANDLTIPAEDKRFDAVLLFYVLQYPGNPLKLLQEACRVSCGTVLILQSTYEGTFARNVLKVREFFFGRFGFYLARFIGLVTASVCPMKPAQYYTQRELLNQFSAAGLSVTSVERERAPLFVKVRRDLFVLQPTSPAKVPEFAHVNSERRIDS